MRGTNIIGTIGPKTKSVEKLTMLRAAGLNIVRMNFSHGSYEYHGEVIDNARQSVAENPMGGRLLAIALDTKGPEIRTGMLADESVSVVTLEKGAMVEADHIVGDMIVRAKKAGIATPNLRLAYAHLQVYMAQRARKAPPY